MTVLLEEVRRPDAVAGKEVVVGDVALDDVTVDLGAGDVPVALGDVFPDTWRLG